MTARNYQAMDWLLFWAQWCFLCFNNIGSVPFPLDFIIYIYRLSSMYILARDYRRYGRDNCRCMLLNCACIFSAVKSTDGVNTIVKSSVSSTISNAKLNADSMVWIGSHSLPATACVYKQIHSRLIQAKPRAHQQRTNRVCARDSVNHRKVKKKRKNMSNKQLILPSQELTNMFATNTYTAHISTSTLPRLTNYCLFARTTHHCNAHENMFWTDHHHPYHLSSSISN